MPSKKISLLSSRVMMVIYVPIGNCLENRNLTGTIPVALCAAQQLCTPMPIRFSDCEIFIRIGYALLTLRTSKSKLVTTHVHRSADIFLKLMFGDSEDTFTPLQTCTPSESGFRNSESSL